MLYMKKKIIIIIHIFFISFVPIPIYLIKAFTFFTKKNDILSTNKYKCICYKNKREVLPQAHDF